MLNIWDPTLLQDNSSVNGLYLENLIETVRWIEMARSTDWITSNSNGLSRSCGLSLDINRNVKFMLTKHICSS